MTQASGIAMSPLAGRGVWIWEAAKSDAGRLAKRLRRHGFGYVAVKGHDGTNRFNQGQLESYAAAARREGIAFGIWGYLRAANPRAEARLAAELVRAHGAAFYIANAEVEYERATGAVSRAFASTFRKELPGLPAALSSFGRIDLHGDIDWPAWRDHDFEFHPQAYECETDRIAPDQCVKAALKIWPAERIRPTLGAYKGVAGRPTAERLADSLSGLQTRGFSVWRVGTLNDSDLRALASVPVVDVPIPTPAEPHRPLALTSPWLEGDDIWALQEAVNKRRRARKLLGIEVDGKYGPEAHEAAFDTAWILGVGNRREPRGPLSVNRQRIIRDPKLRNETQLARAKERRKEAQADGAGPNAVLSFAGKYVDRAKEQPIGTNRGPEIDRWGKPFGSPQSPGAKGYEWCAIFAAAALREAGINLPREFMWTPTGLGWGRSGTNGFVRGIFTPGEAKPGDLIYFDNRVTKYECDHVGLVERNLGGGRLQTIEGNARPDGSPGNMGYGVFRKKRGSGDAIVGITRPRYKRT